MHRGGLNMILIGIKDKFDQTENYQKNNNLANDRNFTMSERTKPMSIAFL